MAIDSAAFLRRFARTECLALLLVLVTCLCGSAVAQGPTVPTVTSGSLTPMDHTRTGGIYDIVFASTGDILFIDTPHAALYDLKPDGKTFVTLSAPGTVSKDGGYQLAGMVIDSHDTLYITDRWDGTMMYRVPYDSVNKTWNFTSSSCSWIQGTALPDPANPGTNISMLSSAAVVLDPTDATGHTLIFSRETPDMSIIKLTLDANGAPASASYILKGLRKRAAKMAIDKYGSLYFVEEPWLDPSSRCSGAFMVPKGYTDATGDGSCSLENKLTRIDPPGAGDYNGVTTDANGNVYLSAQVNSNYGFEYDMVVMVPSEQVGSAWVPNRDHAMLIAPVSANGQPSIDSRGFLWIPTNDGGWDNMPGTNNFVKWNLGSAEVPPAPVTTTGTNTVRVYYGFNGDVTPAQFVFVEPGGAVDFAVVPTSPTNANECVAGTTYHKFNGCFVQVAMKPGVVGDVSGQLQMLDASNRMLATTYVHGVGQGSGVAALSAAVESTIGAGSGMSGVRQLATDAQGNVYAVDANAARKFAAGSGTATLIASGTFSSPTGIAVDGNGNVYVADSGKIYQVPLLSSGAYGKAVIMSTGLNALGANARLAVDGNGSVYAADPANHRIVKVFNSLTPVITSGQTATTVGSGLSAPSAIASDASGNLVVADGTNVILLPAIANRQQAPVAIASGIQGIKGVAIDASGSIYVAAGNGLQRLPSVPGTAYTLSAPVGGWSTSAMAHLAADVATPTSVAVDRTGNVFAGQASSITQLTLGATVNFNAGGASVVPNLQAPAEIQLFNIGNTPLTVKPAAQQVFSDPTMYDIIDPDDSPKCDPENSTEAGAYCWLGIGLTAPQAGDFAGTLTVQSDAANTSPVVAMSATAVTDPRPATTLSVTTHMDKPVYPATATITVTVKAVDAASGTPTGSVVLSFSGLPKQTLALDSNGVATVTLTELAGSPSTVPEAPYTVRASYGGDGNAFAASGGTTTFSVTRAPSRISATATFPFKNFVKVGTNFIIGASVTSDVTTPTGKVEFKEGPNPSDPSVPSISVDANGDVTFDTHNLDMHLGVSTIPPGAVSKHLITAVYDGDINYAPSTSNVVTVDIVNPSVYVDTTGVSFSITAGTPATQTLTLNSLLGYGAAKKTVAVLCTNLPRYSECTFDVPNAEVNADHPVVPIQVTISTNVPVNVTGNTKAPLSGGSWLFASMTGIGLVGLVVGRKTKYNGRMLMLVCVFLLLTGMVAGMSACGNAGYYKQPEFPKVTTPAGTYQVTIIALDQSGNQVALPNTFSVTVH